MFKKTKKQIFHATAGFTLIELIVGVAIFALVMTAVLGIFQQVIRVERKAVNAQNAQENIRYVMEVIAKEIRTAKRNFPPGACAGVPNGDIFAVSGGDTLYLKNQDDECVIYTLENQRFKITRAGVGKFVTSDDVQINRLNFILKEDDQPAVTVILGISTLDTTLTGSDINTQTTISSRYYLEDIIL